MAAVLAEATSPPVLQPQEQRAPSSCNETETYNSDDDLSTLYDDSPYFGDIPEPVERGCMRLGNININNLPIYTDHPDNEKLFRDIIKWNIDVLLMQETGVNWSVLPDADKWRVRVDKFFGPRRTCSRMSHNGNASTRNPQQWGGTGIISYGKPRYFACGSGSDPSGLGR